MKTIRILLLLFFFEEVLLNAQTNVSGNITTNTTWTVSGSPYQIIGDVGVLTGITLAIEPGARVQFAGNYKIQVQGNLIAVGTPLNKIVFDTGGVQTSIMILFRKTNLSNSKISNTIFNGSTNGIQLAQESEFNNDSPKNSGVLVVDSCAFNRSSIQTNGYSTTASLSISNSQFISSTIKGVYPRSEPIVIKNATILNSTIFSDSYNYGISIDSSTVNNSQFKLGCCGANFNISNSNILNSTMYEGGGSPVAGPVQITNSKMIETPINLQFAGFTISNCIFQHANSSTGARFGNGTITNTSLVGNNGNTELEITGYNGYNIGGTVNITKSTFTKGSTAIKFTNANTVTIQNSNFTDNNPYNIENRSSRNIAATQNYWGTSNITEVASKIFDGSDDINYGMVNTNPILTSPDTSAPISPPIHAVKATIQNGVRISWQPNAEPDTKGYKIYYGNYSRYSFSNVVDVGNVSSYDLSGLNISDTIAVTAYDSGADGTNDQIEGHESWFSLAAKPPDPPTNISIDAAPRKALLTWTASGSPKIQRYRVFRSTSPNAQTQIDSVISSSSLYMDTTLIIGARYYYRIKALDSLSLESDYSSEPSVTTPGSWHVSKTGNNSNLGSAIAPFNTMQKAISTAVGGDTVIVLPGIYIENVDYVGKNIVLKSRDGAPSTIIKPANSAVAIVWFHSNENSNAKLIGFTLRDGGNLRGCALKLTFSQPIIDKCIITNSAGEAVYFYYTAAVLTNCLIYKNPGNNPFFYDPSDTQPQIINCTITANTGYGTGPNSMSYGPIFRNCILYGNTLQGAFGYFLIDHSLVQGGFSGTGNIDTDPLFVNKANDDYTLSIYSPTIGAGTTTGAPSTDFSGSIRPNPSGSFPDIGAYESPLAHPKLVTPLLFSPNIGEFTLKRSKRSGKIIA
jgi:hypothetical protein